MLAPFAFLTLLSTVSATPVSRPDRITVRPRVEAWSSRGDDPYRRGEAARVHFRTAQDAYVTVLRVDTDGRVRILYPREPWEDDFARGGEDYEVDGGADRPAFYIDDNPGVGYVFAVAATRPFVYGAIERGDHWDYRAITDGRVRGDPYVALTDLAQRIVPDGDGDWDYDIVPYYVQEHYPYPRFLCYDCHSYASYPSWNPYASSCVRFRIVEYNDPYYYPYRAYGGARAVFTRPLRPEPRFIFKDREGSQAFLTRVPERPLLGVRRGELPRADVRSRSVIPRPPRRDVGDRVRGGDRPDRGERGRATEPSGRPASPRGRPPPHREPGQRALRPEPGRDRPRPEPRRDVPHEKPRPESRGTTRKP
jgi:hypothetical protein